MLTGSAIYPSKKPDQAQFRAWCAFDRNMRRSCLRWFGMGGVMLREVDEEDVRRRHKALCLKWNITAPLHSSDIRSTSKAFTWLGKCGEHVRSEFLQDVEALATHPSLTAIACVIDRPGYNDRYRAKYGRERWSLCKTAFTIVVERAAKFVRRHGGRMRVYVEKSDRNTDRQVSDYYDQMRTQGHPFDSGNASKYGPMTQAELANVLYEFKTKEKSSPLIQIADLCLWPMCIGGYNPKNLAYVALKSKGTLIDSNLPAQDIAHAGIKYSCWEKYA